MRVLIYMLGSAIIGGVLGFHDIVFTQNHWLYLAWWVPIFGVLVLIVETIYKCLRLD